MEQDMTLETFRSYIKTWSAYANYMKDHTEDPVDKMVEDMAVLMKTNTPEESKVTVEWPAVLILTTPE
jgi:hypothetical protein